VLEASIAQDPDVIGRNCIREQRISMPEGQTATERSLMLHDGELDEVRSAFLELGIPFAEHQSDSGELDPDHAWDLVVGTPQRLVSLVLPQDHQSVRIAVTDHDSRTLRSSLSRSDVDLVVRRPVHPAVLRGVILHGLYRGAEKRRTRRVGVGAPVRYRLGWRRPTAVLADLSMGGCRLLLSHRLKTGRSFTLRVPVDLAGGRPFTLRARALQARTQDEAEGGDQVLHCRFESLTPYQSRRLRETVERYRSGPALYVPEPDRDASLPRGYANDRRSSPRQSIRKRVVELNEEAARILMGCDVSLGGMRVDPNPHLRVGQNVRLALYLGDSDQPLLVNARVHRDDGESGLALRFHTLDAGAMRNLRRRLESDPVLARKGPTGETGYVFSEIVEIQRA